MNSPDGFVIVDKPKDLTSHDVVNKLRKFFNTRSIGHAGTLDPMATGVLVLGVNKATRLLTFCVGDDKTYEATIRLGEATDTDDATGEIIQKTSTKDLGQEAIQSAILELTGEIEQIPSTYSAIKVKGKKAYELAREGKEVELTARKVTIKKFEIQKTTINEDTIDLEVIIDCTSGTYIRSLARDLGKTLQVGGHLTVLRRTRSGKFSEKDFTDLANPKLIPLAKVAKQLFSSIEITESEAKDLTHGRKISKSTQNSELQAAIDPKGQVIALVQLEADKIAPKVVFGVVN